VEPSDAKILKLLQRKPAEMSKEAWAFLSKRPFGHIIFPTSKDKDDAPLPSLVGNGDLDGDGYFVLWDEDIVKCLKETPRRVRKYLSPLQCGGGKKKSAEGPDVTPNAQRSFTWLQAAQDTILDLAKLNQCNLLIGRLYGLCKSTADESSNGIFDDDACSFGRAYKDSMDIVKHGGKVRAWRVL
jgi:hypothetical protein